MPNMKTSRTNACKYTVGAQLQVAMPIRFAFLSILWERAHTYMHNYEQTNKRTNEQTYEAGLSGATTRSG